MISFMNTDIEKEFIRWSIVITEDGATFPNSVIQPIDVLRAHFSIVDFFMASPDDNNAVGGIGPKDTGLLISAVSRQETMYDGIEKWKDHFSKLASLIFGLIKNHPFHDCNKRTALLVLLLYLHRISYTPSEKQKEYEQLMLNIARNTFSRYVNKIHSLHQDDSVIFGIAHFLKQGTRRIDKKEYRITYNELNAILNSFGFGLDNPKGNSIDIMRYEEKRKHLLSSERIKVAQRVGHIGFHGWTREVSNSDQKKARKFAGLTHNKGYDSQVFYKGVEPFQALIDEYRSPLRRLAEE